MHTKQFLGLIVLLMGWSFIAQSHAQHKEQSYQPPAGVKVASDIAYGPSDKQTLDVYYPLEGKNAPVIFMIHGGAWSWGDKASRDEFENKVAHWVTKGFVFISTNYRTLPQLRPVEQTQDLAMALRFAQQNASKWGGAVDKFILMGHSSGAHLVSLMSTKFKQLTKGGVKPWLGTVSLDISGYDIVKKATGDNPSAFYLEKFGDNKGYWYKASPYHVIDSKIPPFLAVCSIRSKDACAQAKRFLNKASSFDTKGELLVVDLSHMQINADLGTTSCYTLDVDTFFKSLHADVASLLQSETSSLMKNCAQYR